MTQAGFISNLLFGWFWDLIGSIPMPAFYIIACAVFVGVQMIPIIGRWGGTRLGLMAAGLTLALGYQGAADARGWHRGYDKGHVVGYKLGHAEGLKKWKANPVARNKPAAPKVEDWATQSEKALRPKKQKCRQKTRC